MIRKNQKFDDYVDFRELSIFRELFWRIWSNFEFNWTIDM